MQSFQREIAQLEPTYQLACRQRTEHLASRLAASDGSLLAIGSGGSGTAGAYAAMLHERLRGHLGRSATPLDARHLLPSLRHAHVLLLSFGGSNHDIIDTLQTAQTYRPPWFTVLCGRQGTRLGEATRTANVELVELELESIRDGILGINYLLAFLVVLARATFQASAVPLELPRHLASLVGASSVRAFFDDIHERTAPLWTRETTLVLHDATTRVAALDIEWKFAEAALGHVQIMDYRNFAHGRQLWLERHGSSTAVVALVGADDARAAEETLVLLPNDVQRISLPLVVAPLLADIAGVVTGYALAASAGRARGIDPGRSSVPEFARRLYEWRAHENTQ